MAPFFMVNSCTRVLISSVLTPGLIFSSTRSRVSRTRRPAILIPSMSLFSLSRILYLFRYIALRLSDFGNFLPRQHFLYLRPLPQGQGSFRPTFALLFFRNILVFTSMFGSKPKYLLPNPNKLGTNCFNGEKDTTFSAQGTDYLE